MAVRDRFARLLRKSGVSQSEVGRRIGESPSWVNDRLKGRTQISADEVCRLAKALRKPIAAFYQDCESEDPEGEVYYALARYFDVPVEDVRQHELSLALFEERPAPPGGSLPPSKLAMSMAERGAELALERAAQTMGEVAQRAAEIAVERMKEELFARQAVRDVEGAFERVPEDQQVRLLEAWQERRRLRQREAAEEEPEGAEEGK